VELGMASFALVLETAPGVVLVEGVGDVRIDGDEVGTVAGGPAFLMARSGPCAAGTRHCQVMMARPGTVTFPTAVKSVTVIDGATGRTVGNMAASRIDGRVLHVGQEDTAYVLSVDLGERDAT